MMTNGPTDPFPKLRKVALGIFQPHIHGQLSASKQVYRTTRTPHPKFTQYWSQQTAAWSTLLTLDSLEYNYWSGPASKNIEQQAIQARNKKKSDIRRARNGWRRAESR